MLQVQTLKDGRRAIILRTSDRIAFKRCRRAWAWSSHLKRNLGSKSLAPALWFGSAIHFALEDYHGLQYFGPLPTYAFRAYCIATAKQAMRELPHNAKELYDLGLAMLLYYHEHWLPRHGTIPTYYENGVPQVEVSFEIALPLDEHPILAEYAAAHGADTILYCGTIDRIGIDEYGQLWVVEYKTAKTVENFHFMTDPQISTYDWAARHIYPDKTVGGIYYQQFVKCEPTLPRILANGHVSTASNLVTSVPLYEAQLKALYGSIEAAPDAQRNFLRELHQKEEKGKDRFIQVTKVVRNEHQAYAEAQKILMEAEDMLNPRLALYPNPTRECSKLCSFYGPCVSMDDGSDWESNLKSQFVERDTSGDRYWRKRLPSPETLRALVDSGKEPDIEETQVRLMAMTPEEREAIQKGEQDLEFTLI